MVQRVVDFVTRLSKACHTEVSFRGLTEVVSDALVALFPEASVVIFERDAHVDTVRAVAGARIPSAWEMRAVHLAEVPLIAEAFAYPDRVLRGGALHRQRVAGDDPLPIGPLQVICGAVPDPFRPLYAMLFVAPFAPRETEEREGVIEIARQMLAGSAATAACSAERLRTISAIHAAKREWEVAADALPEIVGLTDRRQRVVRVNRALERWALGDVRRALRRDLHVVLHRNCTDPSCALKIGLAAAFAEVAAQASATFELIDPVTGRELTVHLRPAAAEADDAPADLSYTTFVIADVTTLRRLERESKALNHVLEERVASRTLELTTANRLLRDEVARRTAIEHDLLATQRELEALSERLMTAQEQERQRIAQDLHDSIGQSLTAVKYSLERAQVLTRRQEVAEATGVIESSVGRIQRIMGDVRGISMNLRPAILDDLGAASAVRSLCREWHEVYRDVVLSADISVADGEIPQMLGTNIFRAVQELLNNVARHANASHVEVAMHLIDGRLSVTVRDDGSGFTLNGDLRRHDDGPELRGLRGLRERAVRTGGRFDVSSAPGRGTTVNLEWPISGVRAARDADARLN